MCPNSNVTGCAVTLAGGSSFLMLGVARAQSGYSLTLNDVEKTTIFMQYSYYPTAALSYNRTCQNYVPEPFFSISAPFSRCRPIRQCYSYDLCKELANFTFHQTKFSHFGSAIF